MLGLPSTSAGSSFAESEPNATRRPSAEIEAAYEFASPPRLTYVVVPSCRSRTKTSTAPSASASLRLRANDSNAT